MFPYALLPCHKGAKGDTIMVIKRISAKLSHHKGLMPIYPMENEMPFLHHVVK
jgi:hypothetical protein